LKKDDKGKAKARAGDEANREHIMPPDETTGLLNGNGNGTAERPKAQSSWNKLKTNRWLKKDSTPGEDSNMAWVAWPAKSLTITKMVLLSGWINILLIFVPLGIVSGMTGGNPTVVFAFNFFAIIPLAALLSFATEEISIPLGETIGGLLNASFGNAVELIVCALCSLRHSRTDTAFPSRLVLWPSKKEKSV